MRTSSAEEKLRRILQDYRQKRTKDYRGLLAGRISARRLHRVAYGDKRVFQRRDKPELVDMAVCLLMDLSGSVSIYRELIEQITVAMCDAFKKERMEFIALGYSGRHSIVSIPRLYDREVGKVNLGLEKEWVMTPSYEGLAAAIGQLLRLAGRKQKILFHFTDGEPNNGGRQAIADLLVGSRTKGIIDIHVCLTSSGFTTERFRELYGEDTLFINEINQLPDIVDIKLRERLKI
jgi:nitric oxide reductase activation protein